MRSDSNAALLQREREREQSSDFPGSDSKSEDEGRVKERKEKKQKVKQMCQTVSIPKCAVHALHEAAAPCRCGEGRSGSSSGGGAPPVCVSAVMCNKQ